MRFVACLLMVVAFALSGCGGGGNDNAPPKETDDPGAAAFATLVERTETALEAYWEEALPTVTDRPWRAPRPLVIYTDEDTPTGSRCIADGEPRWRHNSFYCAPDGRMYLNRDWLSSLGTAFGDPDTGVVVLHAHEFGHHLQAVAAWNPRLGIGQELGADCYAGMFLAAKSDGNTSLDTPVDTRTALETMRSIADTEFSDDRWFARGAHGGPIERAAALATGFISEDAALCAGYEKTDRIVPVTVNGYQFRPPAAADVRKTGAGYSLTTATRPQFTLELSGANGLTGQSAVEYLSGHRDGYFRGSRVSYVGDVEDFDLAMEGYAAAVQRYEQELNGKTLHGALVLVTHSDGTALVLDAYADGPAPEDDDDWNELGDYVFSALWGVSG